MTLMVRVTNVSKTFVLHNQDGVRLPILSAIGFSVEAGECVVLHGPSGAGKSTLLRLLYGNYKCTDGRIQIRHEGEMVDIAQADARRILDIRRRTLSYVSQFLRVIPRVPTLDIVKEPLVTRGVPVAAAEARAGAMLARLNIPERLWRLPPATFSGGEQQRVNIARSFIAITPVMLLDEPTASLDARNRDIVIELIEEARMAGSALIGIFHDEAVRERAASRRFDIHSTNAAEAA
ncbi:MAG: phosphonate C-P lyase system protein PhnL [Beijerinckiaceae bacterium]|jgi:alpha-D-ribose 1-methylphosphonate 5-triphosphate synthase subunit PhnL|nr:phosphonate C-P lyase system protein PhnL [Beijerinckiaceae bacterium]MDO9441226.1 phosphonate C-P lyase system protein PhnL [Beijerinckiaceae bacterium]